MVKTGWLDSLAVGASAVCLVHCLALPFVIAAMPALASVLDVPIRFHLMMLILALPISGIALVAGFRRHGAVLPAIAGGFGLVLLAVGSLLLSMPTLETGLIVVGGLLLAGAHIKNWHLRHLAECIQ
jgi:hypothetical protein